MKKLSRNAVNNNNNNNSSLSTNPISRENFNVLNFLSEKALSFYTKNSDIKKFKNLVLDNEIDDNFLIDTAQELKQKNIFDPFDTENYKALANNERLIKDLISNEY